LAWVNGVYLKAMTQEEILDAIVRDVDSHFLTQFTWNADTVKQVIGLYKERVKTLKMLVAESLLVHNGTSERNADDMKQWITVDSRQHLDAMIEVLEKQESFTHDSCMAVAKDLAATLGVKLVTLLQPIRLALLGKASGPGVFDLLTIIGKTEGIARIKGLRDSL